jgi:hypothetical protein
LQAYFIIRGAAIESSPQFFVLHNGKEEKKQVEHLFLSRFNGLRVVASEGGTEYYPAVSASRKAHSKEDCCFSSDIQLERHGDLLALLAIENLGRRVLLAEVVVLQAQRSISRRALFRSCSNTQL